MHIAVQLHHRIIDPPNFGSREIAHDRLFRSRIGTASYPCRSFLDAARVSENADGVGRGVRFFIIISLVEDADVGTDLVVQPGQNVIISGDVGLAEAPGASQVATCQTRTAAAVGEWELSELKTLENEP
eukprot:SAG22_NODE_2555_length_2451_cov_15.623299_3_plen_129_part_00